jgi:hypothetical protein
MYKIPKDGDVIIAIRNVLARYRTVDSLRKFKEMVEDELGQAGEDFRVGGDRLIRLALVSGVARIEVHTRGDGGGVAGTECPVCGSELKESRNMTVYGGEVTLGYVCRNCAYWTGRERREPSRYVFSRKRR